MTLISHSAMHVVFTAGCMDIYIIIICLQLIIMTLYTINIVIIIMLYNIMYIADYHIKSDTGGILANSFSSLLKKLWNDDPSMHARVCHDLKVQDSVCIVIYTVQWHNVVYLLL